MKKCKNCGKRFQKTSGHDQKFCSVACYRGMLFPRSGVTKEDILECRGMTIKDAAFVLGISYIGLRKKLKANPDLRAIFPNRGEGRWLAERGYAD